jgi:hypothetical protein
MLGVDVAATRWESMGAVAGALVLALWALSDDTGDESPDVSAGAEGEIMLRVRRPGSAVQTAFVGAGAVLGRGRDCALVFNEPEISKSHSRISLNGQQAVIEDLHSTNGTLVNGHRIEGTVPLRRGDRIELGANQIIFVGVRSNQTSR